MPAPMTSDRRDGRKRAILRSAIRALSAETASPSTLRISPPRLKLLQVWQRQVAEELDLVFEHDAEFLVGAPPRLGHERERVRCCRTAGVLDEVRVLRGDARP